MPALLMLYGVAACSGEKPVESGAVNNAGPAAIVPIVRGANVDNQVDPAQNASAPVAVPQPPALKASAPKPPAPPSVTYRAIGTEPFWAITIRGETATLERPDHPPSLFAVVRIDNGGAVSWSGDGLSLRVRPGPCSDGMSDAIWSDSVQVAGPDGTLKGCGGRRDGGERAP